MSTGLQVFTDLTQGSDEWLDVRRGMVTASVVGQLITAKTVKPASNDHARGLTATLVAERITGWTEPVYVSDDMMRGSMDEPIARALYSEHYAPAVEVGFMVRDLDGAKLGFSPDGLVGDDGLIEIKSRRPKKHVATILSDEVPIENFAQCQAGLLVSGRQWCDYLSFCGGMPLYPIRVLPDERWAEAIMQAVDALEDAATQMIATYSSAVKGLPATERIDHNAEMVI